MATAATEYFDTTTQFQNGELAISETGDAVMFFAGPKQSTLGKAASIHRFDPLANADTLVLSTDFMIPVGSPVDSIMIADFESANASVGTNPGIRISLRDGFIRVDRTKIGEPDIWYAAQSDAIESGQWYDLKVEFNPGVGSGGGIRIFLDGELILDQVGTTVITQDALAGTGVTLTGGSIDRVQVGITANSTNKPASIALRDLSIDINDASARESYHYEPDWTKLVGAASAIYMDGTEQNPQFVEAAPTASYFGVEQSGTSSSDVLTGTDHDDFLDGRAGNDLLDGGLGNDTLRGGNGSDVFVFRPGMGLDTVIDFTPNQDKIGLDMSMATANSTLDAKDTKYGVLIHNGESGFLLEGVSKTDLDIGDFVFL